MAYIFLDESGDLGFDFFKSKTSKYFVVTLMFVQNKDSVDSTVRKVFKTFTPKERKFHGGVLHAFRENPKTRIKLLSMLSQKDISIVSLYLNKQKVYTKLHETKHALYNYVTNIVLDRICVKKLIPANVPICLVASRRETNKFLNENFKNYLRKQVKNKHKLQIEVEISAPQSDKCLQAVDMICWAIFRNREHGDDTYFNIIKEKIVEESPLFP
jgi:hypothetical protein